MPLPQTRNPGQVISFLAKDKPQMPQKQRVAIGLSIARKNGADIPYKSKFDRMKQRAKEGV